jgi:hypothetical protein
VAYALRIHFSAIRKWVSFLVYLMKLSVASKYGMINHLKLRGNYIYRALYLSVMLYFVFIAFLRYSALTGIISLNNVNKLIDVMLKCCGLFEVRIEFLNI